MDMTSLDGRHGVMVLAAVVAKLGWDCVRHVLV